MADKRFGDGEVPLTDFERELQRRLFGKSQDFPPEFTGWLRLQVEKDPPRLLPTNVDRVYNHPRVRVYHSTTQAVSSGTVTTLTFNSERFDPWAMHDTTTNASRLTAPKAGVYLIGASFAFASGGAGDVAAQINVNGTAVAYVYTRSSSANTPSLNPHTTWALNAGDYAEVQAFQSSGATVNVLAASSYSPEFWMSFLGDYPPS